MKTWNVALIAVLASTLAACGSTSRIKPASAPDAGGATTEAEATAATAASFDPALIQAYSIVAVVDFVDATAHERIPEDRRAEHVATVDDATREFADRIAAEIRETGAFADVRRGSAEGKPLLIGGRITRFKEGNGAARFFIGFGAGSSFFDATVELRDGETGQLIGEIIVDRNSWPLGGVVAATQTVERFMEGAAKKTAAELEALKRGEARG